MQLLANNAVDNVSQFFSNVGDFFQNFSFWYVIETLLLFLLIFYVSKILYDNDAAKVMAIYWVLLVVGGVLTLISSTLFTQQFYLIYVLVLSVFFLMIFHVEVKKSLWDKSNAVPTREKTTGTGNAEVRSVQEVEKNIENIIKALQNMSKNNVGALVVLSRGNLPRQVLQSGIPMDAEISTQLLEGVFFPKAPLHDGAVIIRGHKIQAAGCFLPLTQKTSYPKDFGTRHRAAIGITEVANVISIVVSEETGIISVVKAGVVQRYADYDVLKNALRDYYWQELPLGSKK